MTEYLPMILTPDSILETAVDSKKSVNYDPSGSEVLLTALNLPSSAGNFDATVKSTEINQPGLPIETPKMVASDQAASTATGNLENLLKSMFSPVARTIENISNVTNNYLGQNSSIISNSEKITKESITELIKESQNNYSEVLTNNIRETSNVLSNTTDLVKDINSKVETNKETVKQQLEKMTSITNSSVAAGSSVLEKLTSSKENDSTKESAFLSSTESSLLKIIKQGETAPSPENQPGINQSTSNISNVSLKNNKLVESSEVKNILTPDKTLEKSVSVLSRTLPEAVNNLSTSFTSISPNSSTNNSSFVEGTKIDQSTSTVINQMPNQSKPPMPADEAKKQENNSSQTNEYYLQAIYSALMSGKIRVKLETY